MDSIPIMESLGHLTLMKVLLIYLSGCISNSGRILVYVMLLLLARYCRTLVILKLDSMCCTSTLKYMWMVPVLES